MELPAPDAVGLAAAIRRGEVSPPELVDAMVSRIERVEPRLHALATFDPDRAREIAAGALPDGPFRGVPILLKDLAFEEGERATFGSVLFDDYRGTFSSELVRRIRAAGFVRLGRTTTPEFGLLPTTESALYGPTHNPWDPGRSPGGSSGGAAALVAARALPLAQGSDGGGSIRIPAAACGVFGLKPSRGRLPRRPPSPADFLSVDLALTLSVRDAAAFLDAVAGPTPGDAYHAPPAGPFLPEVERDPPPLVIAYTVEDFRGEPVHPECREAVLRAIELFDGLGHRVVEARPPIDGEHMAEAFLAVWAALAADVLHLVLVDASRRIATLGRARGLLGDRRALDLLLRLASRRRGRPVVEPFTRRLAERAMRLRPPHLDEARTALVDLGQAAADFLVDHDLLVTPVLGSPPLPLGAIDQEAPWEQLTDRLVRYVAFTPVANFSGLPAMSLPLHWTPSGLPVGVHVLGRFGDEATLLRLAGQVERAAPWRDRVPPIHAA